MADLLAGITQPRRRELVERFESAGVAAGPIYRMDEMFADPQVKHLGIAQGAKRPDGSDQVFVGYSKESGAYGAQWAAAVAATVLFLVDRSDHRPSAPASTSSRSPTTTTSAPSCLTRRALISGASLGITMTAGRALGLSRSGAARFSFLLAIPGIGAAGAYEGLKLLTSATPIDWAPRPVAAISCG